MDQEQFNKKLEELKQKFAVPVVVEAVFNQKALRNFSTDLADFINGFLPFLGKKFGLFYNTISCIISGDKIYQVVVQSNEDCPDLYPSFDQLDPPASIRLRFALDNSLVTGWLAVYKDIFVHFRNDNFEVTYHDPTAIYQPHQKNYNSDLFDISGQLLTRLSNDMLTTILNRTNNGET